MRYTSRMLCGILFFTLCSLTGMAQESFRYYRVYLRDKGTPARVLRPNDPLYPLATAHLTERALTRRGKMLPADSLVSTADLPIHQPYLDAIAATGAWIIQTSRWLNTVMIYGDSTQYEAVRRLPFLDSTLTMRSPRTGEPAGKRGGRDLELAPVAVNVALDEPALDLSCITGAYGSAASQNRLIGIDEAHRMGIAGEGVLIGILDAGFHWRQHRALRSLNVIAERDFVYNDSITYDEPEDHAGAQAHGTEVMSIIGGMFPGMLIGGAPHASFALAKTEDIRFEKNIEEDNFVAGLEWLESLGVDITNTSLGYTEFDPPEQSHTYADFNGRTAHASLGLNHAARLGVICVVAAGNDAAKSFHYIGTPAEADSSFAIAAVTPSGLVAPFSSRGTSARATLKPDLAAQGTTNVVADHTDTVRLKSGQGTSYAAPAATASIAIILSARPWLRPYEIRSILYRTASRADNPDTAVGHGIIDLGRAIMHMAESLPVVGLPKVRLRDGKLAIAAGVRYDGGVAIASDGDRDEAMHYIDLRVRKVGSAASELLDAPSPFIGVARWYMPATIGGEELGDGDLIEITITSVANEQVIRRDTLRLSDGSLPYLQAEAGAPAYAASSTLCEDAILPTPSVATAVPNPFHESTVIQFQLEEEARVSLTIYNALGEEMKKLIDDEEIDPGYHSRLFEGGGFPSGAYYYTLRAGDAVRSGEMIYVH